eukprot:m.87262 g.87262  ORF g.87262 m.87262 type:complete len:84 (-) comp19919_c0_seq1:362-613(-)
MACRQCHGRTLVRGNAAGSESFQMLGSTDKDGMGTNVREATDARSTTLFVVNTNTHTRIHTYTHTMPINCSGHPMAAFSEVSS